MLAGVLAHGWGRRTGHRDRVGEVTQSCEHGRHSGCFQAALRSPTVCFSSSSGRLRSRLRHPTWVSETLARAVPRVAALWTPRAPLQASASWRKPCKPLHITAQHWRSVIAPQRDDVRDATCTTGSIRRSERVGSEHRTLCAKLRVSRLADMLNQTASCCVRFHLASHIRRTWTQPSLAE